VVVSPLPHGALAYVWIKLLRICKEFNKNDAILSCLICHMVELLKVGKGTVTVVGCKSQQLFVWDDVLWQDDTWFPSGWRWSDMGGL